MSELAAKANEAGRSRPTVNAGTVRNIPAPAFLPTKPVFRVVILSILAAMAAVSAYTGIREGAFSATEGIDFQWSGSHLLSQHQDPWYLYIHHLDLGKIILGQQPNYLAELFLLLQPLGRMPFQQAVKWWCGLNLLFAIGVVYILRQMFKLDRDHTLAVGLLLAASMPFRVTLHVGQHSLFVLFLLCITFYSSNVVVRGLALGLSYSKYSFAPLIVMMLLVKRRIGLILISVVPPLVGLLVAWRMLGNNLKTLALEPFEVAKMAMGPGAADIMTRLEILLRMLNVAPNLRFSIPAVLGLMASAACAIWIGRDKQMDERLQFAVALVFTLVCLKHVNYDFVVLVVPLAAAIIAVRSRAQTIVLICAIYFWFLDPIMQRAAPGIVWIYPLMLIVMGFATSRLKFNLAAERA